MWGQGGRKRRSRSLPLHNGLMDPQEWRESLGIWGSPRSEGREWGREKRSPRKRKTRSDMCSWNAKHAGNGSQTEQIREKPGREERRGGREGSPTTTRATGLRAGHVC